MDMKFDKKAKSTIAVYAIILFVYVLAFLILPFNKIAASWISFIFTVIAIVGSLLVCGCAFKAKETLVSKIYGFPIFRVGVVYGIAQIIAGIIICAIGAFVVVPYWVALLLSVLFLGAAAIGVIVTDNTRDVKLNELFQFSDPVTNDSTKEIEAAIMAMLSELKTIVVDGSTDDIKKQIKKLTNSLNERNRICKASKG